MAAVDVHRMWWPRLTGEVGGSGREGEGKSVRVSEREAACSGCCGCVAVAAWLWLRGCGRLAVAAWLLWLRGLLFTCGAQPTHVLIVAN